MRGIMIQGTSSDSGKSFITTALCRILANKGYRVAPFKSQNMSNNSYVTDDGCEIGRAQGVQAEAAKVKANVHMNPILLKPMQDTKSEVILHGKSYKAFSGMEYGTKFSLKKGMEAVRKSLSYIGKNYDLIVIEGAGSPAEVNLNHREIVNMRIAQEADVDVILITDIDRGGCFASLVGTLELVFEHRHRIKGVIINKFRGDIRLLEDGLKWFEEYTGVKVVGVIPYMKDIYIETEDAQSQLLLNKNDSNQALDIVVVHMERISNNTDIEPFIHEKDVNIRIVRDVNNFGNPHAVIIPGTKSTIADLETLYSSGLADKIKNYYAKGGFVFGICGGYQVLGQELCDTKGIDFKKNSTINGLGLLPIKTFFQPKKQVQLIQGQISKILNSHYVKGYEIHLGHSEYMKEVESFTISKEGLKDGCIIDEGRCIGTYIHNIFHNDEFRNTWLNLIRKKHNLPILDIIDTSNIKETSYNRLAEVVENHLDMPYIMKLIGN